MSQAKKMSDVMLLKSKAEEEGQSIYHYTIIFR